MSSLNQKALDKLQHPIEGDVIELRDKIKLLGSRTFIDFDLDELITKRALQGMTGNYVSYEIAHTGTGLVIDWQNDLIDGVNTFANVLGDNLPKPVHYFKDGDNYTNGSVVPVVVRSVGVIDTVTFEWGYSADCVIVF